MKQEPNPAIEKFRLHGVPDTNTGAFRVGPLRVIASTGAGWDHVSVSLPDRCPTWAEMDKVKRLFWRDAETVMQLHVPRTEHVNCHPNCLHLWRPQTDEEIVREQLAYMKAGEEWPWGEVEAAGPIPLPPSVLVGPKAKEMSSPG